MRDKKHLFPTDPKKIPSNEEEMAWLSEIYKREPVSDSNYTEEIINLYKADEIELEAAVASISKKEGLDPTEVKKILLRS